MKISIIVPNYNGLKFLEKCFLSISTQSYHEELDIIIVDNGSVDGSVEYIEQQHPEYHLIQNKENLGFAAAVNQGIKISDADYIFLLNNDVVLDDNCISNLLKCMKKDENIFAVASKMIQYHDRNKIDDAGDEYTLVGWTNKVGYGKSVDLLNNEREIFSACAGAGLYRKCVFNLIGYFDENFFAYMEDVDIGYRARIFGYKSVYCPQAIVYHIGSGSSGNKYNKFKIKLAARNNVYVPYKNMPWPQLLLNFIFLITGYFIKYLFFIRKGHGNDYLKGLKEGVTSLDKINKIKYKNERFTNYLKIEWLLIQNSLKYIIFRKFN
jgi:GT2 family glycosyltransferase